MTRWGGEVALTSERLTLRTFRPEDLPHYAALNADPVVVEHLGGPLSREGSDDIAAYANDLWALTGIGLLAVERTEDHRFLGMCGLHVLSSFPDDLEIAWRLAHEHWGRGYATEAATAWLDLAFADEAVDRVISVTDAANVRSLAVMARLGLSFDHEADLVEDGEAFSALVHVVDRATWSSRNPGSHR